MGMIHRHLSSWTILWALSLSGITAASVASGQSSPGWGRETSTADRAASEEWQAWGSRWLELEALASPGSRSLDELARTRAEQDSLVGELARFLEDGFPRPVGDTTLQTWLHERVLEGLVLADPRFVPVVRRSDAPSAARDWDPQGRWTLPATLAMGDLPDHRGVIGWQAASRAIEDEPYLAVLEVDSHLALGDTTTAAAVANRTLGSGFPDWANESLREAEILGYLSERRLSEAESALGTYGDDFVTGPWFLGTSRRLAILDGNAGLADSLGWELIQRYPDNRRSNELLQLHVPLQDSATLTQSDSQLRRLLSVAEAHRGLTRYIKISTELSRRLAAPSADSLAVRGAHLAYKTRRYGELLAEVRANRWTPAIPFLDEWGQVLGRTYRNTGDPDSMSVWFEVAVRNGGAGLRREVLWEWGRELESEREFLEAGEVYKRLLEDAPGDKEVAAWYRLGLCRYQLGTYQRAIEAFLEAANGKKPWEIAQAQFWICRCHLALGQERAARVALEVAAEQKNGYYSVRARSAVEMASRSTGPAISDVDGYWLALADVADAPRLEEIPVRQEMASARSWNSGNHGLSPALNETGYRLQLFRQYRKSSWAGRELSQLDQDPNLGSGDQRLLRLHQLGFPDLAARRAVRLGIWEPEKRYPAPFGEAVAAATERWSISPEWVWAIMRRESFFENTVVSGAGATGLMQFMSHTAEEVGLRHRIPYEPLSSPNVNIALGVAHLRDLVDEVGPDWPYILAGYNAGMHNAVRWLVPGEDRDLFIEAIGFRETRDYVKAIVEGFWIYRESLRGELLRSP